MQIKIFNIQSITICLWIMNSYDRDNLVGTIWNLIFLSYNKNMYVFFLFKKFFLGFIERTVLFMQVVLIFIA